MGSFMGLVIRWLLLRKLSISLVCGGKDLRQGWAGI